MSDNPMLSNMSVEDWISHNGEYWRVEITTPNFSALWLRNFITNHGRQLRPWFKDGKVMYFTHKSDVAIFRFWLSNFNSTMQNDD